MGGNMEISVTKLQPPWKGWPLRNVRIKRMASDKLMGEVGGGSHPSVLASPAVCRSLGMATFIRTALAFLPNCRQAIDCFACFVIHLVHVAMAAVL